MTLWSLAGRSVRFYFRSHVGTVLGAAIATAVLTGALLVGDSVRGSLRQMALARIGQADHAMASGDRLFREALAADLAAELPQAKVAPMLQLPGTANTPDGTARANQVQITGVDERFWILANEFPAGALSSNVVWLNHRLAKQLRVKPGGTILLRVPRISHLSRDAPLSAEEDSTVALRLEVGKVVSDEEFGRFSLAASQVPPFNAFVPLRLLQARANATSQANLLLMSGGPSTIEGHQLALRKVFEPADAQIQFRQLTNALEVRSPRVFLDDPISRAALGAHPQARPVFTYLVNKLSRGTNATPYSMVTASPGLTPDDMRDDEIVITEWLADDLDAKAGDEIAVKYFVMGQMRDLVEKTNLFRVREVAPMRLPYADADLMPDFPGMTDAENCRDWDTGFPINTGAIRDQDEAYWDEYRGAPKAFVTLRAAQEMWSNRFGNLTAVRYPAGLATVPIKDHLSPEQLGFVFVPLREHALAASGGAQDFGGLFAGFSMFLIAAALLLMSLLFRFALDQRSGEIGTLLALGLRPRQVSRMLLLEGACLAILGGMLGLAFAALYAQAMVYGLSTIWSEAVAGSAVSYHGQPATYLIGFFAGVLVAVGTIWWSLRKEGKRTARELLTEGFDHDSSPQPRSSNRGLAIGLALFGTGAGIAVWGLLRGEQARADLFFAAGALVLVSGLLLSSALIRRLEHSKFAENLSLAGMGLRSITRRRKRSRAAIGLLACGAFLIAAIGAFRLDAGRQAEERSSGTGGFALIGEASIPVAHNLNAESGRDFYGLSEARLANVSFVPLRVLEGEDASCLNLNRAQRPRLLGVNPAMLGERGAFTFNKILGESDDANPWLLLEKDYGPNVVPAIGDAASIQWALGKKVGDALRYLDAGGRVFDVKIVGTVANSILQGSLLIAERRFVERFPNEAGYRMFLIDAPSNQADELAGTLSRALRENGLEVTRARDRLQAFNAVQNTYLGTFQLLGGLGLLLGTFGLGVILLRNVFERRSELALLKAIGFRNPALRWLIVSEHAALLLLGLFVGVAAAVIAVLPALLGRGSDFPAAQLGATLGAVLICGLIWTAAAAAKALRAPLLESLRNE
jgi:putative ABC transport system permease protein